MTAYFSNVLKGTIVTGLENVVSGFHRDLFISFEVIAALAQTDFLPFLHAFLRVTQEQLNIFKI